MTSADDVRDMIGHTWDAPEGPGQIALAEQAMRYAEALGDPDLAFDARMAATSAFHRGGEPAKAFVTFARCLADYDADPSRRSAQDEHLLLWYFKYVVSSMAKFPEVPLERTRAVLDDMERRYRSGGHSLHAVYAYRHVIASHVGDVEQAEHWFRQWDSAPRDHNSDCAGCDPTSKAYHHAWLGRFDDAIAVAEPALAGNLTCSEQPQAILTALMIPYLRTGRLDEARDAHRRAYRAYQVNPADLGSVADHLEFCGLTGNEVRGLELIERHLGWLDHPPTPKSEMEFASAAAQILRRLVAQGRSDLVVRAAKPTTVGELADRLSDRSLELAARFDERNGTPYQGDRVRERLDAEPIVGYLPLSLTAAYRTRSVSAPPAAAAAPDVSDALALPLDEQLDRVDDWYQSDEDRARALAERIVEAAPGEDELTAVQRGRLARLRAYQVDRTDSAAAEREFDVAVTAFAEGGDRIRELATRVQRSMARVEQRRDPDDVQEAVEAAEELMAICDDPVQRRATMMRLAYLLAVAGADSEALASLDRADAEPGVAPPRRQAQALMLRSGLLHRLDRINETLTAAGQAIDLLRTLGPSDQLASALIMYANLVGALGDHGSALASFEEAATAAIDPELRRDARVNAGFMLVNTDRAGEVIDDIVEHVCLMAAEGEDRAAAYSRHRLAVALTTTARFREAAEVAEEALAYFAHEDDERAMADECRDLLARVYDEMGEPHAALIQLTALAEGRSGVDDAARRAELLERMAEVLYRVDRDRDAADRYADAAAGYEIAGDDVRRVRALRRRILALHYARDPSGSSQAVEEVSALASTLAASGGPGVVWEHAMACYDGAFVHAERQEYDDAIRWAAQAPALFRSIEAFEESALAELRHGEILVAAGDPAAAVGVLNGVLDGLPRDHRALSQAAWWLARAYEELGEDGKADELRKQHDLQDGD